MTNDPKLPSVTASLSQHLARLIPRPNSPSHSHPVTPHLGPLGLPSFSSARIPSVNVLMSSYSFTRMCNISPRREGLHHATECTFTLPRTFPVKQIKLGRCVHYNHHQLFSNLFSSNMMTSTYTLYFTLNFT